MIKIKDILTVPSLKTSRLMAGAEGIGKEVSNISVMETPDFEKWVQPKVILLTSLYATQDFSYDDQLYFMKRLAYWDISAVIIKTETYVKKVPQGIIKGGDTYGVPVIQISKYTSYNSVTHDVMQILFNEENKSLNYYRDMYENFMTLSLSGEETKSIIQSLQGIINYQVSLYDDSENPEVPLQNGGFTQMGETVHTNTLNDYLVEYKTVEYYVVIIQLDDLEKMYLFVFTNGQEITTNERIAIHVAASFIKLNYVKNLTIQRKKQQTYWETIEGLLRDTELFYHERKSALEILELDPQKEFLVIIIEHSNFDSKALHSFDNQLTLHLYGQAKLVKYREQHNTIVVIIEGIDETIEKNVSNLLVRLSNCNFGIYVGISQLISPTLEFSKAYIEAKDALGIGKSLYKNQKEYIFSYKELGIQQTLFDLQKSVDLVNYINLKLKRLIDADISDKQSLLTVLNIYLDNNQNYKSTANKLGVHWKTVKNRIVKIEKLTGINLNKSDEALDVHLSLKILINYS